MSVGTHSKKEYIKSRNAVSSGDDAELSGISIPEYIRRGIQRSCLLDSCSILIDVVNMIGSDVCL